MIWFTSDTHFDHANIIQYCSRPFPDVDVMNNEMIGRWNDVVKDDDTVYHLGDFGFFKTATRAVTVIRGLRGRIRFVPGSHDSRMMLWYNHGDLLAVATKFVAESPLLMIEPQLRSGKKQPIVLCHYAMRHWERSFHLSWQLHGHTHGRLQPIGLQMDVGVDVNGFTPVSLDRVAERMASVPTVKNDSLV